MNGLINRNRLVPRSHPVIALIEVELRVALTHHCFCNHLPRLKSELLPLDQRLTQQFAHFIDLLGHQTNYLHS